MEIITRQMEPHEAAELQALAWHAFSGLEGVGIPKPKQAIVALHGDRIAEAVQYKLYSADKKRSVILIMPLLLRSFAIRALVTFSIRLLRDACK